MGLELSLNDKRDWIHRKSTHIPTVKQAHDSELYWHMTSHPGKDNKGFFFFKKKVNFHESLTLVWRMSSSFGMPTRKSSWKVKEKGEITFQLSEFTPSGYDMITCPKSGSHTRWFTHSDCDSVDARTSNTLPPTELDWITEHQSNMWKALRLRKCKQVI